jgi:hypothetical protein
VPDEHDPALGADRQQNNNFNYKQMDPHGCAVPLGSHVRRMNLRYIQTDDRGADKRSNWLPSPASRVLGMTMRLYAPRISSWTGPGRPPPV